MENFRPNCRQAPYYTALVALVERNNVSPWAATVIIGREFIITGLRLVAASDGIVIAASKWGKIKTISQIGNTGCSIKNYPISLWVDFHRQIFNVYCSCCNCIFCLRLYNKMQMLLILINNLKIFEEIFAQKIKI